MEAKESDQPSDPTFPTKSGSKSALESGENEGKMRGGYLQMDEPISFEIFDLIF